MNQNPEFADTMTRFKDSLIRYSLLIQDSKIQKLKEFIPTKLYDAYNIVKNIDDYYNGLSDSQKNNAIRKVSDSIKLGEHFDYSNAKENLVNGVSKIDDLTSSDAVVGSSVKEILNIMQGKLPDANDITIEKVKGGEGLDKVNGKFKY